MRAENIHRLSSAIGYFFKDVALLQSALTHRSMGGAHNERLEYLGDSILNFTIAAELYKRFLKAHEGDLSRMRAFLVRGETLAHIARDLSLGEYIQLGIGEKKSGGHMRDSILSDALEAIIGAIYLDASVDIAQTCILKWYQHRFDQLSLEGPKKDPKTRLQEYCQARQLPLPQYQVIAIEGDAHEPIFKVQSTIAGLHEPKWGIASSRRKAEQAVAEAILKVLNDGK